MKRGRIETEQNYFAAIRQTLAELKRDSKARPQSFTIEDFPIFELPPYNFGEQLTPKARPFSEFKAEWQSLERQRK